MHASAKKQKKTKQNGVLAAVYLRPLCPRLRFSLVISVFRGPHVAGAAPREVRVEGAVSGPQGFPPSLTHWADTGNPEKDPRVPGEGPAPAWKRLGPQVHMRQSLPLFFLASP